MPRKIDLRGIESRTDASGREQYRPYVTHPENRNRKIRGPWTYSFPEARAWRARTLAKQADGVSILPTLKMPTIIEASTDFLYGARAGRILSRNRERYYAAWQLVRGYLA